MKKKIIKELYQTDLTLRPYLVRKSLDIHKPKSSEVRKIIVVDLKIMTYNSRYSRTSNVCP